MTNVVRIEIPEDEDIDLVSYFQDLIESDLSSAIDFGVREFDERAQLDSIECTDVLVNGDEVLLTYQVEFSAYYGCSDMDYCDTDERTVRGRKDGNEWVFPVYVAPPSRTTDEEY